VRPTTPSSDSSGPTEILMLVARMDINYYIRRSPPATLKYALGLFCSEETFHVPPDRGYRLGGLHLSVRSRPRPKKEGYPNPGENRPSETSVSPEERPRVNSRAWHSALLRSFRRASPGSTRAIGDLRLHENCP